MGQVQSLLVHPQSVLADIVNHQRTVRNGPIQKLVRYRRLLVSVAGRREVRNELGSAEDHRVLGVAGGIALDLAEQQIGILGT